MNGRHFVNVDLADVWAGAERKKLLRTLAWGDEVEVVGRTPGAIEIETVTFGVERDGSVLPQRTTAFIVPPKALAAAEILRPAAAQNVLKVNFVDVQQGDGAVIESPRGQVVLVDGGDNAMFARYLAARFRGTTAARPKVVEAILVTHGDADHFAGLAEILRSESNADPRKRLFIRPRRVLHNGIVKRPSARDGRKLPDVELLGPTAKAGGRTWLVGLVDDLLGVPDAELNEPFRAWKAALAVYHRRSRLRFRRVQFGDHAAFDFFNRDGLRIEALGPIAGTVDGRPALPFLGQPPKGPRVGHESLESGAAGFKGHSASHTINGHSIVFRLRYGGFAYLFCGDLNDEAARFLAREHAAGTVDLRAEVFKVPHHGSADFSGAFVQCVAPVVSVVSSGDESARKEYIHPRATLMGALGRHSRVPEPLVLVTELVAFFQMEGWSRLADDARHAVRGEFFGFSRAAFGMVKTRTDGRRLLVYTDSANVRLKEAYAYRLDDAGVPQADEVVRA